MQTPKEYKELLAMKEISESMLADCVYSLNKKAKNMRDRIAEKREERGGYANVAHEHDARKKYYDGKPLLLSLLTPVAIHKEHAGYERRRVYDYEKNYLKFLKQGRFVWMNCFYNEETGFETWFGDIELRDKPKYRYYLLYRIGHNSFHSPIPSPSGYEDLPIEDIEELETHGADTSTLLPSVFVNKVLDLVRNDDYTLLFTEHVRDPLPKHRKEGEREEKKERKTKKIPEAKEMERWGEEECNAFIKALLLKKHGIGKADSMEFLENHGIDLPRSKLKRDAVELIMENGLGLEALQTYRIGVNKYDYTSSGMGEREYGRRRGKREFVIVGEYYDDGPYNAMHYLYDAKQFLNWKRTGEFVPAEEQEIGSNSIHITSRG